jgi:hypothetical protein
MSAQNVDDSGLLNFECPSFYVIWSCNLSHRSDSPSHIVDNPNGGVFPSTTLIPVWDLRLWISLMQSPGSCQIPIQLLPVHARRIEPPFPSLSSHKDQGPADRPCYSTFSVRFLSPSTAFSAKPTTLVSSTTACVGLLSRSAASSAPLYLLLGSFMLSQFFWHPRNTALHKHLL